MSCLIHVMWLMMGFPNIKIDWIVFPMSIHSNATRPFFIEAKQVYTNTHTHIQYTHTYTIM